jgi:hypothetical protein
MNGRGINFSSIGELALTGFEARIGLVDDVDTALAAHQLVVAVALDQGLQGIADFHNFT